MKCFICTSPFQAYNTELNKHITIHTGACFVHLDNGRANDQGLLLLYGITADDDKKMWVQENVFKEYFEETIVPAEIAANGVHPYIASRQTMLEALYA